MRFVYLIRSTQLTYVRSTEVISHKGKLYLIRILTSIVNLRTNIASDSISNVRIVCYIKAPTYRIRH